MRCRRLVAPIVLVLLGSVVSYGCSCVSDPGCKLMLNDDAIFLGTVIAQVTGDNLNPDGTRSSDYPQTTTFSVREAFHGVSGAEAALDTGAGMCTYPFEIGQTYLVFAHWYKGKLNTNICTRTQAEVMAGALIQQLEAAKSFSDGAAMAALFGTVLRVPEDSSTKRGELHYKPAAGVPIEVKGPNGTEFATVTDKTGAYEFADLRAGEYQIQPQLPLHTTTRNREENKPMRVTVEEAGSCQQDIHLYWDGRISGLVVDPQGRPVKGVVLLEWADRDARNLRSRQEGLPLDIVAADGMFSFSMLGPGNYFLRFHPAVNGRTNDGMDFGSQQKLPLAEGQHIEGVLIVACGETCR